MFKLTITVVYLIGVLYAWQCIPQRYEKPPALTKQEARQLHKKHGAFTLIQTQKGLYIKKYGEIIYLSRRGK